MKIEAVLLTAALASAGIAAPAEEFAVPKWGAFPVEAAKPAVARPADFDRYWEGEVARFEKEIPLRPEIKARPDLAKPEADVFEVSFAVTGDGARRLYGWLAFPKRTAAGAKLPLYVEVPGAGYGGWTTDPAYSASEIQLKLTVYDFLPHPYSGDRYKADFDAFVKRWTDRYHTPTYANAGWGASREETFFHDVWLTMNRAVNWVVEKYADRIDLRRVSYTGESQGGGSGFFLLAMNRHFTHGVLRVPAVTDVLGFKAGRKSGWPQPYENQSTPEAKAKVLAVAPYFDAENFAPRIRVPVKVCLGTIDDTCPWPNVSAAFNSLGSSDKELLVGLGDNHWSNGSGQRQKLERWRLDYDAGEFATPESQGVSSKAILKWIDVMEREIPHLHSFVLRRHGKIIAEGWWSPYAKELPHRLFSHSKVFTSTAAGFAADEGRLDLDERVADIFPDKMPANPGEMVKQLRVRDLLTMNTGGVCDRPFRNDSRGDWVKSFLADDFERKCGTHFDYNSCATYMVAEVVQRKTGRNLMDYLEEKLFGPLGMTDVSTTCSPSGCPCGGWGMAVKTEDLSKLGQLFLDGGKWKGRQVISRRWTELATAKHTWNNCTPGKPDPKSDWQQGYGFQWWRCQHDCYRADGAGGQFTVVMPDQDAVISGTAVLMDFQGAFDRIWDILLPAMKAAPLPEDAAAVKALRDRCAKLELPLPAGSRTAQLAKNAARPMPDAALEGKRRRWPLKPNRGRFTALVLEPDAQGWQVSFEGGKRPLKFSLGYGAWRTSTLKLNDQGPNPLHENGLQGELKLAAAGAWQGAKFHGSGWFVNEASDGGLDIDLSGDVMKGKVYCWNPCEPAHDVEFEASDRELPVFAWNYYAFTNRMDDAKTIAAWKDLGLNAPLSPRVDGKTDKRQFRAFLDRCYAEGIRPFVYDTRIADTANIFKIIGAKGEGAAAYRKLVKAVVADWGDHPAVRGFYVTDEPEAREASASFLAARIQREEAPHLQPFLNLLPWFDWIGGRIGAKNLGEYLDRARRESGIDFLGYDCYAHQIEGHSDKDAGDYFHNLREWAEFGKRSGSSWNTTLLCVPHYRYRVDSADDFRWQISTAAAMGAKGISWFYPDHHLGPHLNYRDAPINAFGERTPTFTWMSNEMRSFNRQFASAFMHLAWEQAFCVGKTHGGIPAFANAAEGKPGSDADVLSVSGENVLVSFFKDAAGTRYAALVNLSRVSPKDLHVTFAQEVGAEIRAWDGWQRLVDPYDPLRTDKRGPQKVWQPLAPGQLLLIRLARTGR